MTVNTSQPAYPIAAPLPGAQNSVVSVVVGSVDANGNFVAASSSAGLPISGGGGGGGSSIADVLLTDNNGVLFVGRDSGATTGTIFTFYRLDTQVAYTPVGTIKATGISATTLGASSVSAGAYVAGALVDGASVTQGATTDAAVVAGASGSDSAKLRAISRDIGSLVTGPVTVNGSVSTTAAADLTATGTITVVNANLNSGTATAGSTVVLPAMNGAGIASFVISGVYTGILQIQISVDGTTWLAPLNVWSPATNSYLSALTGGTQSTFYVNVGAGALCRITGSTAVTGTATIFARSSGVSAGAIGVLQQVDQTRVAGALISAVPAVGGSGTTSPVVLIGSSSTQIAINAGAWAAATVLTNAGTITESGGTGTVCSFAANVSAYIAGSSTGMDVFLRYSPDGGTTWIPIWQLPRITAAGVYDIPPMYIPGRWSFAYINVGAAATTATVTITATRLSLTIAPTRQFLDRTAAVLAGTPINSATPAYDVSGCKIITASITISTVTTTGAAYQLQTSADGTNWSNVGTATIALVAATTTDISILNNTKRYARVIVSTAAVGAQVGTVIAITGGN